MQEFEIPIWKSTPFFRVLVFFISGIITQRMFQFPQTYLWTGFISVSFVYFLTRFLSVTHKIRLRFFTSLPIFILVLNVGMILISMADPRNQKSHFANTTIPSDYFIVRTITSPKIGEKRVRCLAEVRFKKENNTWVKSSGLILLVFLKKELKNIPQVGTELIIHQQLFPIVGSGNPGSFQANDYYETKGVFHQVILNDHSFKILGISPSHWFIQQCVLARDFILQKLKSALPNDKKIFGIAEALLIGYQDDLDAELMQVYGRIGVVHIIAISGLHVGILFAVFWWITGSFPVLKNRTWFRCFFVLAFLWIFTIISGASPSVLRSTVMFSVMLFGKAFDRRNNAITAMFFSAFLLLAYDPFLFWNLGFQLSYLAVGGILFLQKPIYSSFRSKYKILNRISEMLSVTIAAQITTLPLTLYYFHQFPNYFLLANLILVPLSTMILFLEIGIVSSYWIPSISSFFGKITSFCIVLMNRISLTIDAFPFSNIEGIPFHLHHVILAFGFIILLTLMFRFRNKIYIYLFVGWVFLFSLIISIDTMKREIQSVFIIPHQFNHTSFVYIKGKSCVWVSSEKQSSNNKMSISLKKGIYVTYHIEQEKQIQIPEKSNHYFIVDGKRILIIGNKNLIWKPPFKNKVDFLILSENPGVSLNEWVNTTNPGQIIITAANSKWNIKRWEKELDSLPLRCFSIANRGAFIE